MVMQTATASAVKTVRIIPAKPEFTHQSNITQALRVAAYCRVSTDKDEQEKSYQAQKSYYTDLIMQNPEWQMAGIYADEGISGTQATKRPDFMRMIRDCKKGKIDLIITKSVQRFARNTGDSLEYSRIDAWSKVYELLANQNYTAMADYFYAWNSPDYGIVFDNFIDGKVLFRPASIAFVSSEKMRTSEQLSYGILPMPKYDTTQEEYSSSCTVYGSTFLVIPKILPKSELDNVTYILEAMAYLGKEMVTYQYYDVTLKNKRVQDKDSPEMLELIFKNRTFDLAAIYNWGDALYFYTNIINSKNNNITSQIDASTQKFEEAMKTTIEYFEVITQD